MIQILCHLTSLVERLASSAAEVKVEGEMQVNVDAQNLIKLFSLLIARFSLVSPKQPVVAKRHRAYRRFSLRSCGHFLVRICAQRSGNRRK